MTVKRVKEIIKIMENSIQMMEYAIENGFWRDASYHVQQLIEQSLKFVLMSQDVSEDKLRTHDLSVLMTMLNSQGIQVSQGVENMFNETTSWKEQENNDITWHAPFDDIITCANIAKSYFRTIT